MEEKLAKEKVRKYCAYAVHVQKQERYGFDLILRCHSITFDLIYNDNMTQRRRKIFRKITEIFSVNKGNTGREREGDQ